MKLVPFNEFINPDLLNIIDLLRSNDNTNIELADQLLKSQNLQRELYDFIKTIFRDVVGFQTAELESWDMTHWINNYEKYLNWNNGKNNYFHELYDIFHSCNLIFKDLQNSKFTFNLDIYNYLDLTNYELIDLKFVDSNITSVPDTHIFNSTNENKIRTVSFTNCAKLKQLPAYVTIRCLVMEDCNMFKFPINMVWDIVTFRIISNKHVELPASICNCEFEELYLDVPLANLPNLYECANYLYIRKNAKIDYTNFMQKCKENKCELHFINK